MKRNILAMCAVCLVLLSFAGKVLGHHNINHRVLILNHWVDSLPAQGWFCNSEIPIIHSMRTALKEGIIAADTLLGDYQYILNEQNKPICDKDILQFKPKNIIAKKHFPNMGTVTAIEIEVEGRDPLYAITWIPVLEPTEDRETLLVGQSTVLSKKWKVCDTKEQVENIMMGYGKSSNEGQMRFHKYNKLRSTFDEPLCRVVEDVRVQITDKYETVKILESNGFSVHPTLFELKIQNRSFYSWTYGAMAKPVVYTAPDMGI